MSLCISELTHRSLRAAAAAGAVGAFTVGLAVAAPAASAASGTVVAECSTAATGHNSPALDPGAGDDAAEKISFSGTGTVRCLDVGGKLLVTGTATYSGSLPSAQCAGDEASGGYTVNIKWSDGTVSVIPFVVTDYVEAENVGTGATLGTVSASSSRFAGDTAAGAAVIDRNGCGTASGDAGSNDTGTITFTSL